MPAEGGGTEPRIVAASGQRHRDAVRALWWEYLEWANERVEAEFGVSFDIAAMLEHDLAHLGVYQSPNGFLGLAEHDQAQVGIACLRVLEPGVAEIKRMYVRPNARGQGIAARLLERLLTEARSLDCDVVRLDSARFIKAAHRLYARSGLREIDPYEGSEIPVEFQPNWVFMERRLDPSERGTV